MTFINAIQLKQLIIENPDYIKDILEFLDLSHIKSYTNEIRCAKDLHSNPTGICIKKDTLSFIYRTSNKEMHGDIFTLIQEFRNCSFIDAVKTICNILAISYDYTKNEAFDLPFGGYYKNCNDYSQDIFYELETYPEAILDNYSNRPNVRFQNDGIDLYTQLIFNIRYDLFSDRIVVPWRNANGEIVGIMGRYNGDDFASLNNPKWMPIISFPKSQVLYGFSENYKSMIEDIVLITESEKGVAQLYSMGIKKGVGVGCHSISKIQTKLIKGLFPKQIIICFDEGVDEEYIRQQCKPLKFENSFIKNKVGYIFDKSYQYLSKGSKASPTDYGKEIFQELIKNCLIWI